MKKEQAQEFYDEYAEDLKLTFSSYYKYEFTFTGEIEDMRVVVSMGGDSDDIYRLSVDTNYFKAPRTFGELVDQYRFVQIINTKTGEDYSEYK